PIATTPAAEKAQAQQHFYLPRRTVDPFGQAATADFDTHDLLPRQTTDALDNAVTAAYDYRVLAPILITDPNGNRSAASFDALSMVCVCSVMGKPSENRGYSLSNSSDDMTPQEIESSYASNEPHTLADAPLGTPTMRIIYGTLRFSHSRQAAPDGTWKSLP